MGILKIKIPQLLIYVVIAIIITLYCFIVGILTYDYITRPISYRYKALNVYTYNDDLSKWPSKYEKFSYKYLLHKLGRADAKLFALLDRDGNGLISLSEYESLVHTTKFSKHNHLIKNKLHVNNPSKKRITLNYSIGQFHNNASWFLSNNCSSSIKQINELYFPKSLNFKEETFFPSDFTIFDIPKGYDSVGAIYPLMKPNSRLDYYLKNIGRDKPGPYFDVQEQFLHKLIDPILPENVFIYPKNGAIMSNAILRTDSKYYWDILFRLHFDIYLHVNKTPIYLTPSGINGRLVLNSMNNTVSYFNMWLEQPHTGVVVVHSPSDSCLGETKLSHFNISLSTTEAFDPDQVEYDTEIPLKRAWKKLLITSYPFRAADYHELYSGLDIFMNKSSKQLSHLVVTIGSLIDQSCSEECSVFRENVLSNANIIQILRYRYFNMWASLSHIMEDCSKNTTLSNIKKRTLHYLEEGDVYGVAFIIDRAGNITRSYRIRVYDFYRDHLSPEDRDNAIGSHEKLIKKYIQFLTI